MFSIHRFRFTIAIAALSLTFAACTKSSDTAPEFDPNDKGILEIKFDNIAGNANLQTGVNYTNAAGEQFNVDFLQYYISNIRLVREDGQEYVVPQDESYFLIKESEAASQVVSIPNVPAGNYSRIRFVIGVDSLRNTMDVSRRTGVLDVAGAGRGMYWSWNSGYIFVKMEGTSPQAITASNATGRYRYHIGGFGGYSSATINNIKTRTLDLGNDRARVRKNTRPSVHVTVDVLRMFTGTANISLATNSTVMFSPFSTTVSANYVNMFQYDHVHN